MMVLDDAFKDDEWVISIGYNGSYSTAGREVVTTNGTYLKLDVATAE